MSHKFLTKILKASKNHNAKIIQAEVFHDDSCAIFRGKDCNCEADIKVISEMDKYKK